MYKSERTDKFLLDNKEELEKFHKWYLDYSHEGNISDRTLEYMEDAWLARANEQ